MITIIDSAVKGKRYKAFWGDRIFHFGSRGATTYIDGASDIERTNYLKRHRANPVERSRIDNLTPSAATLSAYLLWGESRSLAVNLRRLNSLVN